MGLSYPREQPAGLYPLLNNGARVPGGTPPGYATNVLYGPLALVDQDTIWND